MTLVMQDVGASNPRSGETLVAVNAATDRLLLYSRPGQIKKVNVPLVNILSLLFASCWKCHFN